MTLEDVRRDSHLSFSRIRKYISCPLSFRFTYVDKIPVTFVPSSLVFGSAMHSAIAEFFQMHLQGEQARKEELVTIFTDYWKTEEEKNEIRYNGDDQGALFVMADKLLEVFIEKAQPQHVIGIEQPFKIELEGLPPLVGVIDLIEEDASGSVAVVDHKCVSKRKSDFELASDLQCSAYSIGIRTLGYEQDILFRFDLYLKAKSVDYVKQYTTRSEYDRQRFIKLVRAVYDGISKQVYYPIESFMCAGCFHRSECSKF